MGKRRESAEPFTNPFSKEAIEQLFERRAEKAKLKKPHGELLLDSGGDLLPAPSEQEMVFFDREKAREDWKWIVEEWGFSMLAKGLRPMLDLEERALLGLLVDWLFLKIPNRALEKTEGEF